MSTNVREMASPTSVYRFYDVGGRLIYVGITSRGIRRQTEHNEHAGWWHFVARQEVEHLATRADARHREEELIRAHRPPFNTQHNDLWRHIRQAYMALVIAEQQLMLAQEGIPIPSLDCGHCASCRGRRKYPQQGGWLPCRRERDASPDVRESRCPQCGRVDCVYLDGLADGREAGWREGHTHAELEAVAKVRP